MTEYQLKNAGLEIATLLNLKADKDGRYSTSWGTKTAIGLARSVQRVLEEATEPAKIPQEAA